MFDSVLIQEDLKEKLTHAISNEVIPHAIFLKGKQGGGNLPIAISMANEVLNFGKTSGLFGNTVKDDRALKVSHPDLHIVFPIHQLSPKQVTCEKLVNEFREHFIEDPYTSFNDWIERVGHADKAPIISVHEALEISRKLSLRSYEGGYQVLIIWMPERMNTECANKLLKLIEEPEAKKLILMVGEDWDAMLPTIRSRMQLLRVKPFSEAIIAKWLEQNLNLSTQSAQTIAKKAEGNPRTASEIANGNVIDRNSEIIDSWLMACKNYDHLTLIEVVDTLSNASRAEKSTFLKSILFRINIAMTQNSVSVKQASVLSEIVERSIYSLSRNAHAKTLFLDMSLKACKILQA